MGDTNQIPDSTSPPLKRWGTQARLEELFGRSAREIRVTGREFVFRYRSAAHWIEVFRTYYGPMNKTFGALDADRQAAFTDDLLALMASRNRSGDGTLVLPADHPGHSWQTFMVVLADRIERGSR